MMISREQRVRMLAYRIWESEGRPDDQDDRHWEMAERIVEAENAREEEQDWRAASDEPSLLEGEEPPAEPDELGIDEMRLPLDDPEVEALKEEDTGVEVHPSPKGGKPRPRKKAAAATPRAAKGSSATGSAAPKKKPTAKARKSDSGGKKSE